MNKSQSNTAKIVSSAKKFLEDKKAIRAYIKGEITLQALNERGIKLNMPV
ncbi:hypothetical protein QWY90_04905 [Flavobacterium paronense]|uniref:Uncharacterized protein n=1 Tax=Flavobacterium paronense TaxID=1392775 RepID=A0ABV5GGW7_9FLAO|nr:hypothetical protein [Flavobacterium paronense]MDN3676647.1 hypothetical protein [Flavobacterium paronense]